jgi:Tol biopolymer transport system component
VRRQADRDYDRHPTFAPDGRRFVFDSSVDRRQMFLATLDSDEMVQIETGLARSSWPSWSPVSGDERILFVGRTDGDWELYTMWDDGTDLVRLTDNDSEEIQPRVSPDGRTVAFASDLGEDERDDDYEIWLTDARAPSEWVRLTDNQTDDWHPAWSPDGSKLAFASKQDQDGSWDIYVMNANGTGEMRLTTDSAEDSYPAWSPDGKRIAFYSERTGDGDIYVMDVSNGLGVTALVTSDGFDCSPAWSPDDRALAFASARDHGGTYATEIYLLDLLSENVSRLTDNDGHDGSPLWSSDGRRIFFTSDRRWGIDDIWVMNADGSDPHNLTEDDRSDLFEGP